MATAYGNNVTTPDKTPDTVSGSAADSVGPGPIFLALLTADATTRGINHYNTTPQNVGTRVQYLLAAERKIQTALNNGGV